LAIPTGWRKATETQWLYYWLVRKFQV